MTRVSDQPSFAAAVAGAGALPFVALSVLEADAARALLTETAQLLGDRSWGVGILGFAPVELREQQLEVLRELRPPVVLIAGGRPSQTRVLEQAGISCFLHVPSPGLLDLFLREGARNFVFEGSECGGHVGPRSSFALWQSVVERLLSLDDVERLNLYFAGGIHDARSAAMVAAMAAPLCARGARVGVLMGTAYLFTHEAVACGAITDKFQEVARSCDGTALLHTAPGHATRTAHSPYVDSFRDHADALEGRDMEPRQRWARLEELNLGRLRIATKGLRHGEAGPESVSATEQWRDGLYMMGQVAALRSSTLSLAELHAEVSEGSQALLAEALQSHPGQQTACPDDIAIVGMACIFADAPDKETFFRNVLAGHDAVAEVPSTRWDPKRYYGSGPGQIPSRWGAFIPEIVFEPSRYGIPPKSLASIDPAQLLSLQVVDRALRDAGIDPAHFDGERTSVFFGADAGIDLSARYSLRAFYPQLLGELPEALDRHLPSFTEDTFAGVLANVIAGRASNRLDLGGTNYAVDAACGSSLAAVQVACRELLSGDSDVALAGGADLHNSVYDYMLFASAQALSPTGRCRVFDAKADGTTLGEGVGALVLKRLSDARRDGDRVYAVIKAVGAASDGRARGLTAPTIKGQGRALRRAYDRAGIAPSELGLLEAHGTGTAVGDRVELTALTELLLDDGAAAGRCTLGSVKSQVGHTKCAAGLAGLIKAALAIHHDVLPPTNHIDEPTPHYRPRTSPFVFRQEPRPWLARRAVAGVSAMGFGGTNFHAVLERPPWGTTLEPPRWPCELFVFHGSDATVRRDMRHLAAWLADCPDVSLLDVAYTVATRRASEPVRVAFVAASREELLEKLGTYDLGEVHARADAGRIAFLFPGQGSQRPGMLADLILAFPSLRAWLPEEPELIEAMMPPGAYDVETRRLQKASLADTRRAQPALGVVHLAMADLLRSLGVTPDMVAGHSYGELSALVVAGSLDAADLLRLSGARAAAILEALGEDPGTMAAVSAPMDELERITLPPGVTVANHNAPEQVVITGPTAAIERAIATLAEAGLSARPIPVACAFHSPALAPAVDAFRRALSAVACRPPALSVWSNVTGQPHADDGDAIRALLAEQLVRPVRFVDQVRDMYAAGARTFVEVGPGSVLSQLVGAVLGDSPHRVVTLDRAGRHGLRSWLEAMAELAVMDLGLDVAQLFAGRRTRWLDFDTEAPAASPMAWVVDGQHARPLHGPIPNEALKPTDGPVLSGLAEAGHAGRAREQHVVEYLRSMRELAEAQRQVMVSYLGGAGAPQALPEPATTSTAPPLASLPAEAAPGGPGAALDDPVEALVELIAERTGYPTEMLEGHLDLEADLGIDSIKRVEIMGTLGERHALWPDQAEHDQSELLEDLAELRTIDAIAEWLRAHMGDGSVEPAARASATESPAAADDEPEIVRLVPEVVELQPLAATPTTDPPHYAIVVDALGVADHLTSRLSAEGARVSAWQRDEGMPPGATAVVDLGALDPQDEDPARSVFERARAATAETALYAVATALGGDFGTATPSPTARGVGVAGLVRSLAAERTELGVRIVDLDLKQAPDVLATQLHGELGAIAPGLLEVGHRAGRRVTWRPVAAPRPSEQVTPLGPDDVVLLIGGARGITARVAIALARRFGCRLELAGRSPLPSVEEDPAEAACADRAALRRHFSATGARPPEIEARCDRILAQREVRQTLSEIRASGAPVGYHTLDVRNGSAVSELMRTVQARHGRLDAVIHAAGVIDDRRIEHKEPEAFARVYDTKVQAARAIASARPPGVRLVAFFSSVSAVFGNRGQTDYAAANDVMDHIARSQDGAEGTRFVSINWGPWCGVGMVDESLARHYRARGVALIPAAAGAQACLDELVCGNASQVVLMAAPAPRLAQAAE
ncbi:MAG: SDR family NAD(P)-dependent oxidoreductase [Myxococcales bacterium]|nr:SDR family NAD(P)-dependent oxidoreductase [Myxococcales bacterium]